jgi:uncharacterized membrane protein YkvA (DUF1232 family)
LTGYVVDWVAGLVAIVLALAAAWLVLIAFLWVHRPTRDLIRPAMRLVPDLARLVRRLLAEPETPLSVRLALIALLVWLVSPIDLVPEFVPGLGPLDDIVVAILVLRFTARRMGPEHLERLWPGDRQSLDLFWRLMARPVAPPASR